MPKCKNCGSYAINHHAHGRDGSDGHLCDVCYWRKRAEYSTDETLANAVRKLHKAKGRHHTQLATCELFDMLGLPCVRPATIERAHGIT